MLIKRSKKGYSLLETIIGITILSIGILSVLSISVKMISAQDYVKNRQQATLFAVEGLEVLKIKLEDNFLKCKSSEENYLNESWSCWGDILFAGDNCLCSGDPGVFSVDKSYVLNFNSNNWVIQPTSFNSWNKIYYNCLDSGLCYYSHNQENLNSKETIYERNITLLGAEDYNGDYHDDLIKVKSSVRWKDMGRYKQVTLITDFYNWR